MLLLLAAGLLAADAVIALVRDLQGLTMAEYAGKAFSAWKLAAKGRDDGLLVLVQIAPPRLQGGPIAFALRFRVRDQRPQYGLASELWRPELPAGVTPARMEPDIVFPLVWPDQAAK